MPLHQMIGRSADEDSLQEHLTSFRHARPVPEASQQPDIINFPRPTEEEVGANERTADDSLIRKVSNPVSPLFHHPTDINSETR
jgi:hypothetical protein